MLVASLPWLVGCTQGLWALLCGAGALGQPLTMLQLEVPSLQWSDSPETKPQPTDSSQELFPARAVWPSDLASHCF